MSHDHGHGGGHGDRLAHEHGHAHGRDAHGNPEDLDGYLAKLESPERIAWQRPDEVVAALGLKPGDVACDVGVGPGYFALRLARAVAPGGRVHAFDVEPRMLDLLARRLSDAGVTNVVPHLGAEGEVAAPPEPCDVVLVVNTYHHFRDGAGALRLLAARLKPGGRLVNVDFHAGELPVGPPADHKISREDFLAAAAAAGLEVEREETFLPYQYFVALRPAARRG